MPETVTVAGEARTEVAERAFKIALALALAGPGDRAECRRMDERGAPLFWRQVARLGIAPHEEGKWLRFTRMAALLTPASATESFHDSSRKLGAVLADGGDTSARLEKPVLSEQRFARLLAARGDARAEALEGAIRMIARRTRRIDSSSLAWALLSENGSDLARSYYKRLDNGANVHSEDTND